MITGPAIIIEAISTVVVEPGWDCEVTERNDLILTDRVGAPTRVEVGAQVNAIDLELFNNRFAAIAEQMGATLEKPRSPSTSRSDSISVVPSSTPTEIWWSMLRTSPYTSGL